MTTTVELNNSLRVDQDTFPNSTLTSFKKFVTFLIISETFSPESAKTGAAGLEPAVTVLETVGLPLTDAPIFYFISLWGVCL